MVARPGRGPRVRQLPGLSWSLMRQPLDALTRLVREHGDLVDIPVPGHRVLVVTRPEHVEHVLVTHEDRYGKSFTYRPLRVLLGDGLITAEGEGYTRQRRVAQPLFSHQHVAALAPPMAAAVASCLRDWDRLPDGATLDVAAAMSSLALDIVGRTLFGAELAVDGPALAAGVTAQLEVAARSMRNPLIVVAPALGLRTTPGYWRWAAAARMLDAVVARMVAQRRAGAARGDLLDALLAAAGDGPGAERRLRDEIMTFFMAGHETTSTALAWALALLSIDPGTRERLGHEVDTVLAGREPAADDATALVWTRAVVQEAMRLYPPLWTIERDALQDDEIDGIRVPAGATVVISPYLVHRNPDVWPNPEGFSPERFLPEASLDRHRLAFLPFGAGRRGCIGRGFAMLEATIALAMIAQRYEFDLLPGVRPAAEVSVTLRPRGGLPMTLRRR